MGIATPGTYYTQESSADLQLLFPHSHVSSCTRMGPDKMLMNKMTYPGESVSYMFEQAGIISVQCDIHPSMQAYIPVLQQPFLVSRSKKGGGFTFSLPDTLADQTYRVKAWFEGRGWTDTASVKVTESGPVNQVRLSFN